MTTMLRPPTTVDTPSADAERSVGPVPPRRRKKGWGRWVLAAVLIAAVGGGWFLVAGMKAVRDPDDATIYTLTRRSFPVVIEAKGELKAKKTTDIKCKVEGRSTIIWVIDEGSNVEKGDLLVTLASDQIEERIRQEEANEASAIAAQEAAEKDLEILIDQNKSDIRKAALKLEVAAIDREKYIEGDAKKDFMDAELEIERTEQMYERAKLDYDAALSLHEKKFITTSDLLQDKFTLQEAQRSLEKGRLSLEILEKYTYPKELRQRNSDLDEARKDLQRVKKSALAREAQKKADVQAKRANLLNTQNKLKKYREQKDYTEIRAPSPGLVVYDTGYRWDPRKITEGSEVHERQTLVTLPDTSVMVVSVRIHEAKTNKIELGQRVNVEIEGVPDVVFTGEVTKIAPLADSRNQWLNPDLKEYETEITLDQSDANLKPGMTARTEIIVTELKDVLCVPLQAVFSKAGRHYVFCPNGQEGEPIEVTLGESSNEYVEVRDGLQDDDRVLLAISDAAKRLLPDLEPVTPGAESVQAHDPNPVGSAAPKTHVRRAKRSAEKSSRGRPARGRS